MKISPRVRTLRFGSLHMTESVSETRSPLRDPWLHPPSLCCNPEKEALACGSEPPSRSITNVNVPQDRFLYTLRNPLLFSPIYIQALPLLEGTRTKWHKNSAMRQHNTPVNSGPKTSQRAQTPDMFSFLSLIS